MNACSLSQTRDTLPTSPLSEDQIDNTLPHVTPNSRTLSAKYLFQQTKAERIFSAWRPRDDLQVLDETQIDYLCQLLQN